MGKVTELRYTKIRGVKSPTRANPTDAGIDVYIPYDLTRVDINKMCELTKRNIRATISDQTGFVSNIQVYAGEQLLLPLGLLFDIPEGYMLKVEDKSSVAVMKGLHVTAGVIDSSYEGELILSMINVTNNNNPGEKVATLTAGDKIAQLVLVPVETPELVEVQTRGELFKEKNSARGDGGFGSTGNV